MTRVRWLGHAAFMFTTDSVQHCTVLVDPWITGNPLCPLKIDDVERADIVCVTHGHPDHLGDAIKIVKKTGGVLIGSPEIGAYAEKGGITYDGKNSYPMNIGGSVKIKGVEVIMTNAAHTADIWEDSKIIAGSGACGYVIVMPDKTRIYHAGDTGLFGDMRLIGEIYQPDIAILPVGGKYNMGIREAAFAASLLSPDMVIPMHYGTYPNQKANIQEFVSSVKFLAPKTRVTALKPGEHVDYT